MHILQLLPRLDIGGVERGVLDLSQQLIQRGHRVSVVSAGGALVDPLSRTGAMHYTMPVDCKAPWVAVRLVSELWRLIQAAGVDIVHARSRVPAWIGYAAARRTQIPFVTTCHGFYTPHLASRVMGWGRLVIVPSDVLARDLRDRFGVPPERIRVIPRGVDLAAFQFRAPVARGSGPWRVGVVGRLTTLKGHEVAIRALHYLRQRGVPVRLCVIGDAPQTKPYLRERLERFAQSLGVQQAIEWMGTRTDIPQCLAALDVVVAPSIYPESFGRSVMEAQAVGVPVVASRLGAFAELIDDGTTGLLVRPGDFVGVAEAISRVMQDADLRSRLVEQARQRVETQFTVERMAEATIAVYEECVRKPRVLIWKLSALGDAVLATPSFRAIRRHFPHASISLITSRAIAEVVARCPYVNQVLVYDPTGHDRTWRATWRLLRRLRREGFDVSVDLQNSRLSHGLAWLAGIPVRIGYHRRWGRLLNRSVSLPRTPMDPVSHQHHLLTHAGLRVDGAALELWPSEEDAQRAARLLQQLGVDPASALVGLHPGGSDRWKTKRWGLERWAELCDRLTAMGAQVIVTGTATETALGERLLQLTRSKPFLAIGKTTLLELACVMRRCRVVVTHDSASLHVAAAMGTPTVALFGPTDPSRHVPSASIVRVVKHDVFCSPCYSTWCRTITHACMKGIRVEDVLRSIADCGLQIADLKTDNPKSEIPNPQFT